ncbi:MAG: hypothetical protein HYS21_03520 [Deltaproteobacteria bacterium]|nr:hypothetical protein [Deltaproteobacteria bacterium]
MNGFLKILGYGRVRILNIGLLSISGCLALWITAIWLMPMIEPNEPQKNAIKDYAAEKKEVKDTEPLSYEIIVERNVFREARRKMSKPVSPPPVKVALLPPPEPPPPTKRPPPKLTLIGTVILEDSNAAIIEYGGKPRYYQVGESIEEFVIQEIDMTQVFLKRGEEPLRIRITPAH